MPKESLLIFQKILNEADTRRRQIVLQKSKATKDFKPGKITAEERDMKHTSADKLIKETKQYREYYQSKRDTMTGSGRKQRRSQTGRGAYFFNDAKEMLQRLTLIIAEMKAGNTSVEMSNMGVTILDVLLHSKHINKGQYRQLVKK